MKRMRWLLGERARSAHETMGILDEAVKSVAIKMSRRSFMQRVLTVTGAVAGINFLNISPTLASSPYNRCTGSCGCHSVVNSCCSPNGQYCYYKSCDVPDCWAMKQRYAVVKAYDDGSYFHDCAVCWA